MYFSEAHEELRLHISKFLEKEVRPHLEEWEEKTFPDSIFKRFGELGFLGLRYPPEYGGQGGDYFSAVVLSEEMAKAGCGGLGMAVAVQAEMATPPVFKFGTEEQKRKWLVPAIRGEQIAALAITEPDAGSDVAAITTVARRYGDHYVVNGTKMWQGMGHRADWMFTLVRTDRAAKKQAGISFLLIDMKSPGLTVQPIITIDGHHEVNTIFLDNVRVPVANRVHQENRGWDVAKFLLGNERTGIARIGMSKYLLRRALRIAAEVPSGGGTLADDPGFRRRAVEIEVELRALEVTQMRVLAAMREHSDEPDPRSSILKVKGVELRQAASELLLRAAGPLAFPAEGEFDPPGPACPPAETEWSSTVAPVYFILRAASIYGGSTEVQKNILAQAVLGLPK